MVVFSSLSKDEIEVLVQLLLAHGADPNAKNNAGRTALHLAVLRFSETVVRLLLEHGVDLNARDRRGKTALKLATPSRRISYISSKKASEMKAIVRLLRDVTDAE